MNPKDYKPFYDKIAVEAEVHKDLVSEFVSLNLPGLGTFKIRTGKLRGAIKRNKDILGNLEKMTYSGYEKHLPVVNKLKEMEDLLEVVDENIKDKKQFRDENK